MIKIGELNERAIIYQRLFSGANWCSLVPKMQWVLVIIIESEISSILEEIVNAIIDNNPLYICCGGEQSEKFHDFVDDVILLKNVNDDKNHFPDHFIMTTWDADWKEALWYAAFAAVDDDGIKTVLCLDATRIGKEVELIHFVHGGYRELLQ